MMRASLFALAAVVVFCGCRAEAADWSERGAEAEAAVWSARRYQPENALLRDRTGTKVQAFWFAAQAFDALLDGCAAKGDADATRAKCAAYFRDFTAAHPDRTKNVYNDDQLWWCIACTRAAALTGETRYLDEARGLFDRLWATQVDDTLGGGMWWRSDERETKNSCDNFPAVITALNLYQATGEPKYLDAGRALYDWAAARLFNPNDGTVYDHVTVAGERKDWDFSYNTGTFLGASLRLYDATGAEAYLANARKAADHLTGALSPGGVLKKLGQGDLGAFNGIGVRYLAELAVRPEGARYRDYLVANATAAWAARGADGLNGPDWSAAPGEPVETQTAVSAVMLYYAAARATAPHGAASFARTLEILPGMAVRLTAPALNGWELTPTWTRDGRRTELTVRLTRAEASVPPRFKLSWMTPPNGAQYLWHWGECRGIPPEWVAWRTSSLSSGMPLYTFKDAADRNVLTLATSEAARLVHFKGGVREEGCLLDCVWAMFEDEQEAPLTEYTVRFLFDARPERYDATVQAAADWISRTAGYVPAAVPEAAFDPLYSTWYNFHHELKQDEIDEELALAAPLGMKTVIIDDGWETDDPGRDFAFTGDWQVTTNRFPDIDAHIARAQALGFRYMMWYAVPFVGRKSANYARFKGKYLIDRFAGDIDAAVLDPRYPEVRQFIIDTYVTAMKAHRLDGLKLDFIDAFGIRGEDPAAATDWKGCDERSVPAAVDRLMTDVRKAVTAVKPDALLEFRQTYIGPAIRQYGNMFRVGDCPGDPQQNRLGIAQLRLTSGTTAVHADMLEWNPAEEVHAAALNVLNTLFGVIQYSTVLKGSPEDHFRMIRHWLDFSARHRGALVKGAFRAHRPEAKYPLLEGWDTAERVFGVYSPAEVVAVPDDARRTYVVNGTLAESLVLELAAPRKVKTYDVFGAEVAVSELPQGLARVAVPAAGYLELLP